MVFSPSMIPLINDLIFWINPDLGQSGTEQKIQYDDKKWYAQDD